ncbi:MAG: chromosome segregation protein SMC [Firmicutes bacterium]|nr:chromosome segregation protein SMC [Bacillota bacterium]
MYFKRLDMHGFKSFAEPVSLEFMDGITCIVGPNGSGKSNIADAIRWVLGEQSPKLLRGGRMEEVIFAGTESRKARGIAEVTLVIDNHDNVLPIEYDEVAITRRMVRSGESEYLINGNPCRLKDVRELIMDTGMGLEGYSIIGQGKISDIINNRGEGRRAIFEGAAGIARYRSRKTDAERKLGNASGNLDRVNDIIYEIESRIDSLREDSEKAREYLELRERGRVIEINLAVRQVENHEARKEALLQEQEAVDAEEIRCADEREQNEQKIRRIRDRMLEMDREAGQLNDRLLQENQRIGELKNTIEVAEGKEAAIAKDRERLNLELLKTDRRILEESAAVESFEQRKNELSEKLSLSGETLAGKEEEYRKLTDAARLKQEAIDEKKSAVFELSSGISVARTEILGLRNLADGLVKRETQLKEERIEAEKETGILREREARLREEAEALIGQKEQLEESLKQKADKAEELRRSLRQLAEKQSALTGKIHQAETKKDLLTGFQNSYEGYNQAVRFIMGSRERFAGIHGVVTDLIDVPEGYETAIQTALGGSIQNIICEDDRSASECVRILKRERAGRATFLPVKSIKGGRNISKERNNGAISKEPGFVGFAADLVSHDKKYDAIADYLLGRTAVTETLEDAVRLSKRYAWGMRFVTLEGEEINPGGAITGGRYKNTGPNLFERKNEIRSLEEKIRRMTEQERELEERLQAREQALASEEEEAAELDRSIRDAQTRLGALAGEMKMAESRKAVFEENLQRWNTELSDIQREIGETETLIAETEDTVKQKSIQIRESEGYMDDEIRDYETAREEAERLSDEISRTRITISTLESDLRHTESGIRRSEEEIGRLRGEQEDRKKEIGALETEKEETGELIRISRASLERAQESYEEIRADQEALLSEKEEENRRLKEQEDRGKALEKILQDIQARKYDVRLKISRTENQIETVKNNLWDRYEVSFIEAKRLRQETFAVTAASKEAREIRNRMKELEPVNIGAIEEYRQVSERYGFLTEQREDLQRSIESLRAIIAEMDKLIHSRFLDSFGQINKAFQETYTELFGGGKAELILEDPDNVLETSVDIVAQPPGKKLQNINLLSGGEKSVTAIALLCALLKVRPTPFCILDEAEAALDDENIDRFIRYLKKYTDIQFIVVTHQKVTMEQADILYGVTMPEKGISQIVSLRMEGKDSSAG